MSEAGVLGGLVLVAALFAILIGPQFLRAANLELMARQTAIVCVAALGMTMVIVAGGIDLSVGSVIALATVVTALLLRSAVDPLFAALGAVVAGGAHAGAGCLDRRERPAGPRCLQRHHLDGFLQKSGAIMPTHWPVPALTTVSTQCRRRSTGKS